MRADAEPGPLAPQVDLAVTAAVDAAGARRVVTGPDRRSVEREEHSAGSLEVARHLRCAA